MQCYSYRIVDAAEHLFRATLYTVAHLVPKGTGRGLS